MKQFLFLATALVLGGAAANAQTVPAPPPAMNLTEAPIPFSPETAQADLDAMNSLVKTTNLWEKRFDWKELGASTTDVVGHIREMLGPDAPVIEVRGKDISRTTFTLPQAPLGSVLCSLAELANDKVWVFPGRLVLAPESALSADENDAIKDGKGGWWAQTYKWDAQTQLEQVTVRIVIADMKERLAAKGQTEPLPLPPPPQNTTGNATHMFDMNMNSRYASYELPFGDLNTVSQQALQALVTYRYSRMYGYMTSQGHTAPPSPTATIPPAPTVPPEMRVCLDERQASNKTLFLRQTGDEKTSFRNMTWNLFAPRPSPLPH